MNISNYSKYHTTFKNEQKKVSLSNKELGYTINRL